MFVCDLKYTSELKHVTEIFFYSFLLQTWEILGK